MIVAAVSRGSSFKGVAAYLASPREDQHRALWTATNNLGTNSVQMGARIMAATALDADAIKLANGWNGKGRKSTKQPVRHMIMSWDESRHPDATHQKEAGRELLKAIGFGSAQSIMVGHNDNGKTHVHIVANIIDPKTGKQFSESHSKRKMQAWALDYCKANGIDIQEIAPNRAKNAEVRAQAAETRSAIAPGELEGNKRLSRSEWLAMRDALLSRQATERAALKKHQGADWEFAKRKLTARQRAEKAAFRKEHAHQKEIAKAQNRPYWQDLFRRQQAEVGSAQFEIERAAQTCKRASSIVGRALAILPFVKSASEARADLAIVRMNAAEVQRRHEIERKSLAKRLSQQTFDRTLAALPNRQRVDLSEMKIRHERQWRELKEKQAEARRAAGIRGDRAQKAENEKTQERRARQRLTIEQRREKMRARQTDEARREIERMRERDQRDRDHNNVNDRDRDL